MSDYSKLVKELRGCKDMDYCTDCPRMANGYVEFCNIKDDAAAAIEELEAKGPHWVSVEDELPEPNKLNKRGFCETYLVRYQWCGDSFAVARWNGRYWILGEHSLVIKKVTHWMPIEPPKEVQE